ncbi:MAG: hypothetical protein IIC72_12570 [Acidobacteria bacterium]|nr:hypothetical protein [Acidobacteriota bacterium]
MIRNTIKVLGVLGVLIALGAGVGLAVVIGVKTGSFYYEDSTVGDDKITAKVGDQLRFVIEDAGKGTPHTVEIPGLGISSGPLATSSTYVTPVITKPGEYRLFCKPHWRKGHETTLVVTGTAITTSTPTTSPPNPTTTVPPTPATTTTIDSQTTTTVEEATSTTTIEPSTTTFPESTTTLGSDSGPGSTTPLDLVAGSLPSGVTEPDQPVWTRSLPLAALALVPLIGIAIAAGSRRRTSDND